LIFFISDCYFTTHTPQPSCVGIDPFSCGASANDDDTVLHPTEEDDRYHTEEHDRYSVPVERRNDPRCERDQHDLDDEFRESNNDDKYKPLPLKGRSLNKMARQIQNKLPPTATEMLVQRLSEYESIGRLSRQEYSVYRNVLEKHPGSKHYLQQISTELDQIAQSARAAEISSSRTQETAADEHDEHHHYEEPQSILHDKSKENFSQRKNHVSWGDQDASNNDDDDDDDDNDQDKENSPRSSSTVILEPAQVWKGAADFDEEQMKELFVEMCFFARLGFVQPPCCLQCTYRESIHKKDPKTACQRWVVWRKDVQQLLHPDQLEGNILIIKCHVARSLLAGENVDGREWDTERQVVFSRNI
jgi:hypothetical protein